MRSVMQDFQAAVDAGDANLLAPLLDPEVRLFGSVRPDAFVGRETVLFIFGMLITLIQEPRYITETSHSGGLALLMRGAIGDQKLDGIHVITFGDDGLITEFLDFVRPLPALIHLQDAATQYLADLGM